MLIGEVTSRRMAIVSLRVRGTDQAEIEVNVMLDTGFTDALALDEDLIRSLGWPRYDRTEVVLANGTTQSVDVYDGRVWWDSEWVRVPVEATAGMPVIGMSLLDGHLVTLEVVDGGDVTVEPIE